MVGALARFNNNYDLLHPSAKQAAEKLGIRPVLQPLHGHVAQVVETVHCFAETITVDGSSRATTTPPAAGPADQQRGRGVGASEVPRGLLIHDYTYENGLIKNANLIIPTGMNLGNMDADLRALRAEGVRQGAQGGRAPHGDAHPVVRPLHLVLVPYTQGGVGLGEEIVGTESPRPTAP